jgi:hypothetical protein
MPGGKDDDETQHPGFTVSDRRTGGAPEAPASGEVAPEEAAGPGASSPWQSPSQPSIDFHTFILSLGSSALFHLGELDGPDGQPSAPDLPLAKHTIDVIAMLEVKTRGNLNSPEASLVESLLYDLRLRYVEKTKGGPPVT